MFSLIKVRRISVRKSIVEPQILVRILKNSVNDVIITEDVFNLYLFFP